MTMGDRADASIAALALLAGALVMCAPLVGRAGSALLADLLMAGAALAGLASFALAGRATLRAARRPR
jgi:hypothetical protein